MSEQTPSKRIDRKQFTLTYSNCDLDLDTILDHLEYLRETNNVFVLQEVVGNDKHVHAYVNFFKKYNCKTPHAFDVTANGIVHQGIIQSYRGLKEWMYGMRDRNPDPTCWTQYKYSDIFTPENYIQRKRNIADFDHYWEDLKRTRHHIPSVTLEGIKYPTTGLEKRNLLILADVSWGKTLWVQNTFKGHDIFCAGWDNQIYYHYDGQQILIWDEHVYPKLRHLIEASNIYPVKTPCSGEQPSTPNCWPAHQERFLIVLLIDPPPYWKDSEFTRRFITIDYRGDTSPPLGARSPHFYT